MGNTTSYQYDEAGSKIRQVDPNGNTTTWAYDNQGNIIEHTLPLGMSQSFSYDAMGNLITKTDFNGDTTVYEYSPCCGRIIRIIYPDGSETSYTHTGTGKKATILDARGLTTNTYDLRGRLFQVEQPNGTITYTYDNRGNRTSVTTSRGTTDYTFDELNRLATVTDQIGGVTQYTYDAAGNRSSMTNPAGTITQYTYDELNRLIYLENSASSGWILSSYDYTLDLAGNRTQVIELDRTVNYTYDAVHRLTQEKIIDPINGNETIAYTYDGFGNRLTKTDNSGSAYYTYDENDRLIIEGRPDITYNYTYDNNGNTLSKSDDLETILYDYDYENRLTQVQNFAGQIEYAYDESGIRVASSVNGDLTRFLVDKNRPYAQVLEERDDTGNLVSYVYGDDLISQNREGDNYYYLYDGLMCTRQLVDSTENELNTYTYDAFGVTIDHTGLLDNNYQYAGEQLDPNAGLYYLRARYYDQGAGRFVTTDPFEGFANDPKTLHKYMYANANPVMFVDPSGQFSSVGEISTGMAVSSILISSNMAIVAGIMHVIDSKKPIKWQGSMIVVTVGTGCIGGGGIKVKLESECRNGKKARGEYIMLLFGFSGSLPGPAFSESSIKITTPGILGLKPKVLQGHCLWTSASVVGRLSSGAGGGFHTSFSSLYMGAGIAEIVPPFEAKWGYDVGLDFMGGVSIGMPGALKGNIPCS